MTAPLTPPQQPSSDPWQAPPAGSSADPAHTSDGPGLAVELRQAAVLLVVLLVAGLLFGLLWWRLAPQIPLVADETTVYLKDSEGEQAIGVDGTFTLIGIGLGVVSGLLVFLLRRRGGVPLVVALMLGSLLGAVIAWRFGMWLGPTDDVVGHAREVGKGVTFDAPLELKAKGALLAWPIASLAVHLALNGLFGPRDPEPQYPPLYGPPQGPAPHPHGSSAD
ncbi:hypothetical protein HUT18_05715 [Streptomyces sp. NA04227]|uniref:hypothetical protein n=1 Tax=Streptomyces sp. NA04227 TaxID=2742136 RepID=UPI001592101D|nr:hypothetical protein [Streptomyces sp. NA04227]QKW05967.1 hypothetical protein HUT18_05715 [Streptomyces sp. NA04227]